MSRISKTRPSCRKERAVVAQRQRVAGEGLDPQFALDAVRGADDGHLDGIFQSEVPVLAGCSNADLAAFQSPPCSRLANLSPSRSWRSSESADAGIPHLRQTRPSGRPRGLAEHAGKERRLSALTVEAYERDTRQFLQFLTGHCGGAPGISDIANLRPADLRAFLAARRKDGAGARTLGRGLAGVRSLLRFLERKGLVNAAGAAALRAPKQPKSLPKPLTAPDARRVVSVEEQLAEEPWIAARNAAVLTLLYGSGLRISEALGLLAPSCFGAWRERAARHRQGRQDAAGAGAAGGACRRSPNTGGYAPIISIRSALLFRGARGGPLNPAIVQRDDAQNALARSICRKPRRRTRCATPSPRICSGAAATCASSRNCWATPACRPRRSIPASIRRACWRSMIPLIHAHEYERTA